MNCDDTILTDITSYKRFIGKLLYLTITRTDISNSVQQLSKFLHNPKKSHMEFALRIVKYVKEQPSLGLFYPATGEINLVG